MQTFFLVSFALSIIFNVSSFVNADPSPTRIFARQGGANTLDAAQESAASQALSIYNGIGTTAFAAPTAGVCRAGLNPYTSASGTLRCCEGSVINSICFVDDLDIIYDADPYAVLDGSEDAPDAAEDPEIPAGATTRSTARRSSSTGNYYLTATTFTGTAIGGTTGRRSSTSSSISRLSLTLTPTGGAATPGPSSGAIGRPLLGITASLAAVALGVLLVVPL